jgi:SAM-dependent methyltransferase
MVASRLGLGRLLRVLHRARQLDLWSEVKPLLRDRLLPARIEPAQGKNPPPLLFQMATGYWISQAIYVAAKLGIADLLTSGPQSCVALATSTGSDASSLFRLMRALTSVGIFVRVGRDGFALSRLAESLQTEAPGSLRAMVITIGEIHYQACGNLLHSVQTGSPAFNDVFGTSLFDHLRQNVDAADAFNQGMANVSSMLAYAVLMAYDFAEITSIVDIGGGQGNFLEKILQFNPDIKGTVFDTDSTIERAEQQFGNDPWARRCSYVTGDFFDSVPPGSDAYLLCGVIHDWDDARAVRILRNCRWAMAEQGRVIIVDMVVPDTDAPSFSKLLDLNMLVMNGGRERTQAEFCALLDAAGCKLTRVVPTMAPQSIIEAIPKRRTPSSQDQDPAHFRKEIAAVHPAASCPTQSSRSVGYQRSERLESVPDLP